MAVGENTKYGEILAEWQVPEYIKYERDITWYVVAGVIAAALLIHAIITKNFLFVIIIFLVGTITYFHERRHPEMLDFMIVEGGIILGSKYYAYKELKGFWIIYEPPVKLLYFGTDHTMRKELPIHLEKENPLEIREILLDYLDEDLDKEDIANEENLARLLKL